MPARALRRFAQLHTVMKATSGPKSKNAREGITTGGPRPTRSPGEAWSEKQKCPRGHYDTSESARPFRPPARPKSNNARESITTLNVLLAVAKVLHQVRKAKMPARALRREDVVGHFFPRSRPKSKNAREGITTNSRSSLACWAMVRSEKQKCPRGHCAADAAVRRSSLLRYLVCRSCRARALRA